MARKSPPPPFGRPPRKPAGRPKNVVKGRPARYGSGPFSSRSRYSRRSQRHGVLFVVVALFLGIAGIAVANAFSSSGGTSLSGAQATTQPTPAPTSESPSPTPKATRSTPEKTTTAAPETAKPRHHETAAPVTTPKHTASPTPKAAPRCPDGSTRLARARSLIRHPSSLPQASVVTAGSRPGTLGTADLAARRVTLYLRSCAEEPTSKLAIVWMYEAGQFIDVDGWSEAKRNNWRQARGASLASAQELLQDAAAVYTYWQTGSTASWQSPVPPPPASQLPQLAAYLNMR